jgi:hypothetical protein
MALAQGYLPLHYVPALAPRIFLLYVPHPGPTGKLASFQSGQMWSKNTGYKEYTSPFFWTVLRAGPDLKTVVKLQYPPSRTIDSLLKQCNPLRLVIERSWTITQEPSIFCRYELQADVSGTDLLGTF